MYIIIIIAIIVRVYRSSQGGAQKHDLRPPAPLHARAVVRRQLLRGRLPAPAKGLLDAADAGGGACYRGCLRRVFGDAGGLGSVDRHCGLCVG